MVAVGSSYSYGLSLTFYSNTKTPGISEFPVVHVEFEEIDGQDGEDHNNSASYYDYESKYWG